MLADDLEAADLTRRSTVCAAAQLAAVIGDRHRPHGLAVLLVEEGIGAGGDGIGHRAVGRRDRSIIAHHRPDLALDGRDLRRRERPVQGEVEAQAIWRDQRPGLPGMFADGVAQRSMEQVRGGVVAHRPRTTHGIDLCAHDLADRERCPDRALMDDQAADGPLGVLDVEGHRSVRGQEAASVADLAAALGVERRLVEDDLDHGAGSSRVDLRAAGHDGHHRRLRGRRVVAQECGLAGPGQDRLVGAGRLGVAGELRLATAPRALALSGEGDLEPVSIDRDAVLGGQLDRQVDGEAERVVEPEGEIAIESWCIGRQRLGRPPDRSFGVRQLAQRAFQLRRAGIERAGELSLFSTDDGGDLVGAIVEVGVDVAHGGHDHGRELGHERLTTAQQTPVPDRAPQDASKDVTATLVGRANVVGDQKGDGPRVIGDDLIAEAFGLERLRIVAQDGPQRLMDRREEVGVVVRCDALDDRRQALQAKARVDAGEGQRHAAVRSLVELHEDEVPELAPARTLLGMVRHAVRTLGELDAPVEVDLRARSARPGVGHAPEVLVVAGLDIAPACHALIRQADLLRPDVPGDVVVLVRGRGQPIGGDAQVDGQELPGPLDRLALEVIAEAPVAEHLEERVVAWRAPDLLEVVVLAGHAQAALDVDRARVGDLRGAGQHLLELDHARVREEERLVAGRHEAGAGHHRVSAFGEELDEAAAELGSRQRPDAWVRRGGRDGHPPMVRNSPTGPWPSAGRRRRLRTRRGRWRRAPGPPRS